MRILVQAAVPTDKGNQAISDGTVEKVIQETAEKWHPEAMYFGLIEGKRGAFMVVDLPDASSIPAFAEPFFQRLGAELEWTPVMTPEDLAIGLGRLAQQ